MEDNQTSLAGEIKVLVCEDNPAVREFIERSLSSVGYRVAGAIDGQNALDMLAREKFDLLVSDIVMPNVDGVALAEKAARLFPDLRIVLVSGYVRERRRAHDLDSLVRRVLSKPFSLEEIREAVRTALSTSVC